MPSEKMCVFKVIQAASAECLLGSNSTNRFLLVLLGLLMLSQAWERQTDLGEGLGSALHKPTLLGPPFPPRADITLCSLAGVGE